MTEDAQRKWDVIFKWFGLIGVLVGGWWTVHTYIDGKNREMNQQKYVQGKDEEDRTKEQNGFVFERQASLYLEVSRSAATIAIALDPYSDSKKVIDAKTLKEARERFEEIYWGELAVVEDRRVEIAMVAFRDCLQNNGENCERPHNNQYEKPMDKSVVLQLDDPILRNFALELAACTRSALMKDRGIRFGQVEQALTFCPYD
jgi:hypothetical protein